MSGVAEREREGRACRLAALKPAAEQMPYITADLSGTGGCIKAVPEHFQVEEILPYAPMGSGEHVFVTLRRAGWNTTDVAGAMGRALELAPSRIGWGGRKDKHAVTTQTFSLQIPETVSLEEIRDRLAVLPFDILAVDRHKNKLKAGHVAANRFRIILSDGDDEAKDRAEVILRKLRAHGVPNFFGEQRFGDHFHNIDKGTALFLHPAKYYRKSSQFWVSVVQSALFNVWLKNRIDRGEFNRIIDGDIAKKTDTGGLFTVTDPHEANERFTGKALIYTGPIYGYKMMAAARGAGEAEAAVLDDFGLHPEDFKRFRSPGSRRPAVLYLPDLTMAPSESGLEFSFTLPSGAYATTVMREFIKT